LGKSCEPLGNSLVFRADDDGMGTTTTARLWRGPTPAPTGNAGFAVREARSLHAVTSLPPLPAARPAGLVAEGAPALKTPTWSPFTVAGLLFAIVWICFGSLAAAVTTAPATDVAGLGRVLAVGSAVVALVLLTLSVAHAQVSGLRPRPAAVGVLSLGLAQGLLAQSLGSGSDDLWGVGAWVFVLIGVAVPLAWVGGQFQSGVRRQRVERHESLAASWINQARHQANQTVQSVHRHDVRSMLFVIDGAARTLADETLSPEQRASFAEMLAEGVERLGALVEVRSEEIATFAVDDLTRAVVHAERKAGRPIKADVPSPLTAVGRAADVTAVLRTLVSVTARGNAGADVHLRVVVEGGAVVVRVEAAGASELPLLIGNWEAIRAETFKPMQNEDDISIDLYVAARLLAEQGADVWSTSGRARFAVRLPLAAVPGSQEEA
jgi:hypothetical protein